MILATERAEQIHEMIANLDTLDADQAKFEKEVLGAGGATWAIERYAADMFYARQMARIVRPLLAAYETMSTDEWLKTVKRANREMTDRLINNHGRHNSTSLLQNAINQWEAEAMSKFVTMVGYWLQGDA